MLKGGKTKWLKAAVCHLLHINTSGYMIIMANCETVLEAKLIWRLFRKEKHLFKPSMESMHHSGHFQETPNNKPKTFVMLN